MKLSEAQKLAVETVDKNVCVSAGAGSGKTRVLVERFLHWVTKHEISPAQILTITFTERAANEMKRRIVRRLTEEHLEEARREVENATIGTIHSFCARLLREHPVEAGVDPYFVIFETTEAEQLQRKILDETLERLSQEAEIFNLLRIYGEESVRKGILQAFARSRNFEASFEEILRKRIPISRPDLETELREGLEKIEEVKGAREVRRALDRILHKETLELEEIQALSQLKSQLRAAGKQKQAIARVQELLLDLAGFFFEEKSLPFREVFIRVALEFEKAFEAAKRSERALDFDDLQLRAVRLLGSETPVSRALRKIYQEKFREILVDEFQDTNPLQNRLLELLQCGANLFVVGDLRQSIYGFRGTQVEIFQAKEKAYASDPKGTRIALVENHRSQPKLIGFLNFFFETLWQEDAFGFEPLQAMREETGEAPCVERLALEEIDGETADHLRIREARSLARRIRTLGQEEGFHYRDIACLFEAMSDVHFYEQALRQLEIPYFVVSNRGFYSQPEIRDILSFLSALENPKQDVPLAAALRSPLFQISDDTLFWLARRAKQKNKKTPLAEGVFDFESIAEISDSEKKKLQFFKETFGRFLEEKEKLRISELAGELLRITSYDLYVLKLRQGERRYANLKKLVEIARESEAKEPIHLGDFVRLIQSFETQEVRESQAQIEAEEGDVVKLMSIHAAKGLEFPVVVLPDLARGDKAERGHFLVSQEEGLGIKYRNEITLDFEETLTFRRSKARLDRARSEESKRLFYVAMTRAKERLILSGPKSESKHDSFHDMSTWADWVERILSEGEWEVREIAEEAPPSFPFERRKALAERKALRRHLENLNPVPLRETAEEAETIFENLFFPERAYFQRIDLPVSAFLLFAKDPEEYFRVYELGVPQNLWVKNSLEVKTEGERGEGTDEEEERLTPAEFGTRLHQILEQVWIRRAHPKEAAPIVKRWTKDLIEAEQVEILAVTDRFLETKEAREIFQAKRCYPEMSFTLRLPYGLIQGTMDLIYQDEEGRWIILDYKTSMVDEHSFQSRGEDYRAQLELYALAAWQILGEAPREALAYFLRPNLTYRIPFVPGDFEKLLSKFTGLQKQILQFRKERVLDLAKPTI